MHHSRIANFEVVDAGYAERRIFEHTDAKLFRDRTNAYIDDFRKLVSLARLGDVRASTELYRRFKFRYIHTRTLA